MLTQGSNLGVLGAAIIISSLAFDAFAQNIVRITETSKPNVSGTSAGILSRTETYAAWQLDTNSESGLRLYSLLANEQPPTLP